MLRTSNLDMFLERSSPRVPVQFHTEGSGSSSSPEEAKIPQIKLGAIWEACEQWSCYGVQVPLHIDNYFDSEVHNHYFPSLSAIQIFTIEPFAAGDGSSSSRSPVIGSDGAGTSSAKPNPSSDCKHRSLPPEQLGYLYFQFNELIRPFDREPLTYKMQELAMQHQGLSSLTSSDLSPYSWISIAWYPIYSIPPLKNVKELSASFLTYHCLKPNFPETFDDKVNEIGKPTGPVVVLPPFASVNYKAFGDVWIRPGTDDFLRIEMREKAATSWVETLDFKHSDLNFFLSRKPYRMPRW